MRPRYPRKNPCLLQGLITVLLLKMGSEAEEFGGNSIQAVVAHHLEDDVDQHSSDVESSHQSQASPEFFGCCWGLIVGPGAGSVGHRLIATSTTLAKEVVAVQQSSLRFISAPAVDSVASPSSASSAPLKGVVPQHPSACLRDRVVRWPPMECPQDDPLAMSRWRIRYELHDLLLLLGISHPSPPGFSGDS